MVACQVELWLRRISTTDGTAALTSSVVLDDNVRANVVCDLLGLRKTVQTALQSSLIVLKDFSQ